MGDLGRSAGTVRAELLDVWSAALRAVASDVLVQQSVHPSADGIRFVAHTAGGERPTAGQTDELEWRSSAGSRVVVVGAGKAGAGMVEGFQRALGADGLRRWNVSGWVNVPDDCVRPSGTIHLHGARPAGLNEPTSAGVQGAKRILELVSQLDQRDLCVVLLSGGGSALLPQPIPGVSLEDKLAVTRQLSSAGASISQLNRVRRALSQIKGGGLARACRAGTLVTLVISDVLGDDLPTIASGPTVMIERDIASARAVWSELGLPWSSAPASVRHALDDCRAGERQFDADSDAVADSDPAISSGPSTVAHLVVGNNRTAVEAARTRAEQLGYLVEVQPAESSSTTADEVGRRCAEWLQALGAAPQRRCVVWGGEPVVRLVDPANRGRGGRNQQVVLAAALDLLDRLNDSGELDDPSGPTTRGDLLAADVGLLSGGTDGEDGPTDAAGALMDRATLDYVLNHTAEARRALDRNDAYTFLRRAGALVMTGPTHTNVCDLRIMLKTAVT